MQFVTTGALDEVLPIPPPKTLDELPWNVQFVTAGVPELFRIPPPTTLAELPLNTQLSTVGALLWPLLIPPPP